MMAGCIYGFVDNLSILSLVKSKEWKIAIINLVTIKAKVKYRKIEIQIYMQLVWEREIKHYQQKRYDMGIDSGE